MSENVEYQPVTHGTYADDTITDLFRMAVRHSIEEKLAKGLPIARYDKANKKAYLEYPNGRREYTK